MQAESENQLSQTLSTLKVLRKGEDKMGNLSEGEDQINSILFEL